jgi:hypothetical protein
LNRQVARLNRQTELLDRRGQAAEQQAADSIHPSADSPKGCSLLHFEAASRDPKALSREVALLGLDLPVVEGDNPQLRAIIAGPRAQTTLTS